jgi:hypothetical protein
VPRRKGPEMKSCKHCMWDIVQDKGGEWKLAYGDMSHDDDEYIDLYKCESGPVHEPST